MEEEYGVLGTKDVIETASEVKEVGGVRDMAIQSKEVREVRLIVSFSKVSPNVSDPIQQLLLSVQTFSPYML